MKRFEYRILNLSEVEDRIKKMPVGESVSWLDILNDLGKIGWQYTGTKPTSRAFLLMRELPDTGPVEDLSVKNIVKAVSTQ